MLQALLNYKFPILMQNKQELINQLQILAPDIDVEALIGNIEINGNDNIVIKGVNNSTINIHQITKEVLLAAIKKLTQPPKYLNNITYLRSDTVFGREADIANIKQKLFQDKQLLLVSAIGGVGKTTAAIYYAKQYEKEYAHILWINGEREVEDQLLTDAELLTNLKLDVQVKMLIEAKDRDTALALVKNKLKSLDKPVLWIVDNANTENIEATSLLHNTFMQHHFLITSRRVDSDIPSYALKNLSENAAIKLFYADCKRIKKIEETHVLVQQLVEKVLYHALIIHILAKTLQKGLHIALSDFVKEITEQHIVYLEKKTEIRVCLNLGENIINY